VHMSCLISYSIHRTIVGTTSPQNYTMQQFYARDAYEFVVCSLHAVEHGLGQETKNARQCLGGRSATGEGYLEIDAGET